MKFLIDTQLPPRLATYLSDKGYNCIHTTYFDKGYLLEDEEIILLAQKEDRMVVT